MSGAEIELLAPAGSVESLKAAIHAGADAVYIGGSKYGARAYANNPGQQELLSALDYVHLHGKKIYLTVNTLLKNQEIEELYSYLLPYYLHGLDGVIVQDFGAFTFLREHFKGLPLHASTQMAITGQEGAKLLEEMGASRIVTARELSLKEIRKIKKNCHVEIESFVHGALCYCYSGQCLMSSMLGGRSGNRGRCAQPCRLPYEVKRDGKRINGKNESYVLSPKDMCTVGILPDIIEAGVSSLKIEGRMKSPEYTAGVVAVYRKYIDLYQERGKEGFCVSGEDRERLEQIYSRGGFHESYYMQHNGRNMITLEKPSYIGKNEKLEEEIKQEYVNKEKKIPIEGIASIAIGKPMEINISCKAQQIICQGNNAVLPAERQPATMETIEKQLKKTGNTPFVWEKLQIDMEENAFVPIKELNELRRNALEQLKGKLLARYRREEPEGREDVLCDKDNNGKPQKQGKPELNCLVHTFEQLEVVKSVPAVSWIYVSSDTMDISAEMIQGIHKAGKKACLAMPYVFREEAIRYMESIKETLEDFSEDGCFDAVLVRSVDEIHYVQTHFGQIPMRFDYYLYVMNDKAWEWAKAAGADTVTEPLELNYKELRRKQAPVGEMIAYGYVPLMVTAGCIHKTLEKCDKSKTACVLTDRYQTEFLAENICRFCYNLIYNSVPLSLLSVKTEVLGLCPKGIRLQFTREGKKHTKEILNRFIQGYFENGSSGETDRSTRGHWKRGVE